MSARDQAAAAPADEGYRMPAEWEPHRATWLVWPHHRPDWEIKMPAISWVYVEIVRHLVVGERVAIIVRGSADERHARAALSKAGVALDRVEFHRMATDRSWIRDSGPIFVVRTQAGAGPRSPRDVAATDWEFNAWARYENWTRDNRVPARVARALGMRRVEAVVEYAGCRRSLVLEGGAIDVDGAGLLLTTEECLLSPVQARNPGVPRSALERALDAYLGARRVLWLPCGIAGDDTHGHIDDVARFVRPRTIVAAIEPNRRDENHRPLARNLARLTRMRDPAGRSFEIVTLPMPRPLYFGAQRLPASYLNFYIANRVVLVPTFNDPNDRFALAELARLFRGREVVGIHAVDLVLGLGTIHCLTQQEPSADG